MTFTEIFDKVYGSDMMPSEEVEKLEATEQTAWRVWKILDGREGFADWWHDIDEKFKDEIFEEIKKAVQADVAILRCRECGDPITMQYCDECSGR